MKDSDILIVGGGPAGMTAAIKAAEVLGGGDRIRLYDKNDRLGRKIYLTGRGRCNLTNSRPWNEFSRHIHPSAEFFRNSFRAFSNEAVVAFFESLGVPCVELQGRRIFPSSMRASDVAQALERRVEEQGIEVVRGAALQADSPLLREAKALIIATGGKSYPATGSTGDGYAMAESFGHTVTRTFPSETALHPQDYGNLFPDSCFEGGALEVRNAGLSLKVDRDMVQSEQGDFNFTRDGLESGIAYWLSRKAVWALINGQRVEIIMDLKPALTLEKLSARIARDLCGGEQKPKMGRILRGLLPEPLIEPFRRANPDLSFENLACRLKEWHFCIDGYKGYERAVVTAGGVCLKEIVPKTLASRLREGLFFAGEVLDLDGDTGGYNLQIAFSTGALAGISAARYIQKSLL